MKKIYIEPCSNIVEMEEDEMIQTSGDIMSLSSDSADENYKGGGDAKSRTVNFSDEDFGF